MKTFILDACAPYTQGTMVIAVESIEKFQRLFGEYHEKKLAFLRKKLGNVEQWEKNPSYPKYGEEMRHSSKLEQLRNDEAVIFFKENNHKPFDFEIDTGTKQIYDQSDPISYGLKKSEIEIFQEHQGEDRNNYDGYWIVVKEFESDLPEGTHYYGEYCA